MLRCRNTAEYK